MKGGEDRTNEVLSILCTRANSQSLFRFQFLDKWAHTIRIMAGCEDKTKPHSGSQSHSAIAYSTIQRRHVYILQKCLLSSSDVATEEPVKVSEFQRFVYFIKAV